MKFSIKKTLLATLLFCTVFAGLGLFYGTWGLSTDDWGNLYHTMMAKSWKDFGRYFINIELASNSINYSSPFDVPADKQAFLNGLLRPLTFVYYWIECHIFGINPYAIFLVSAAFHAGSTALLFHIFASLIPLLWAFLAALFFGFHPSLWIWWGFISPQSYYIELFFLLMLFICLHKFLQTKQRLPAIGWYTLACLLYIHNMLVREQTFFLSLWLIPALYFYDVVTQKKKPSFLKNWIQYVRYASGFFTVTIGYFALRLWLFPFTSNTGTLTFEPTWSSFAERMSGRFFDFVTYVANLFSLTALPLNHQVFKGSLIVGISMALTYLFVHNSRRLLIAFLALSVPLFSWPALLMHHQPRYAYMSYPFFIFMLVMLYKYYQGPTWRVPRFLSTGAVIALITINAHMITTHTLLRQGRVTAVYNAFTELIAHPQAHGKPLYVLGTPPILATGTPHAVWLLKDDNTICVHNNSLHFVASSFIGEPSDAIKYTVTPDGIVYTLPTGEQKLVDRKELCAEKNPLYATWDYMQRRFVVLGDATIFTQSQ